MSPTKSAIATRDCADLYGARNAERTLDAGITSVRDASGSPLGMKLAGQLVAVQVLHGADELGRVDPIDVDHLGLHGALDGVGQALDGRHGLLARPRRMSRERHRLAEGDQHPAPEGLPDFEGESDGNQRERRERGRTGSAEGFVVERDPSRAGLDPLDAAFGVGGALRIDHEHVARCERLTCRDERLRVAVRFVGALLAPMHRDGSAADQERGENGVAAKLEYQLSKSWSFEATGGDAPAVGAELLWSRDF